MLNGGINKWSAFFVNLILPKELSIVNYNEIVA